LDLEKPDWLVQMEGILETLNEGVMISDDCHTIIFVNNRFLEMCGLSMEEISGRTPNDFYFGDDYDYLTKHIALGEKLGHDRFEFFVPQAGEGRLPVVLSTRTLEDPDGRQFAIITFTDISEQKEAEARLKTANQQLEQRQLEIDAELELAARVQQSLTPQGLQWGRVTVEAFYQPVRTIGGDFGLVSPYGDEHLNLLVCDVSGHGISSALVANRIYSETIAQLERGIELSALLEDMNQFVLQHIGAAVFYFSLAAVRLDARGRRMQFAGAGHPPVMVARRDGGVELLHSRSLILGMLPEAVDPEAVEEVGLGAGDRVVLYTDGFSETFNGQREMLGVEGLRKIVQVTASLPLVEMKQEILDAVSAWRVGPPADDMSLVLLEVS
jgi:PAS domain S-box-containing protein